jgi:hypothetical protein
VVETKDVILGAMGSAAALAGFDLVFLGIVIAAYQSYSAATPGPVIRPYRVAGAALFGAFALSLVTVTLCLVWLVSGGPSWMYGLTIAVFIAQLAAVLLAAGWTVRMVLWP